MGDAEVERYEMEQAAIAQADAEMCRPPDTFNDDGREEVKRLAEQLAAKTEECWRFSLRNTELSDALRKAEAQNKVLSGNRK